MLSVVKLESAGVGSVHSILGPCPWSWAPNFVKLKKLSFVECMTCITLLIWCSLIFYTVTLICSYTIICSYTVPLYVFRASEVEVRPELWIGCGGRRSPVSHCTLTAACSHCDISLFHRCCKFQFGATLYIKRRLLNWCPSIDAVIAISWKFD